MRDSLYVDVVSRTLGIIGQQAKEPLMHGERVIAILHATRGRINSTEAVTSYYWLIASKQSVTGYN